MRKGLQVRSSSSGRGFRGCRFRFSSPLSLDVSKMIRRFIAIEFSREAIDLPKVLRNDSFEGPFKPVSQISADGRERCEERVACKMFTELAKFDRRRANYNTCSPSTDGSAERRANSRNLIYRRQINTAAKVSLARRLPNPSTNDSMNFVLSVNRCSRFYGMILLTVNSKKHIVQRTISLLFYTHTDAPFT